MTLITEHHGSSGGHIEVTGGNLDLSGLDELIITPVVNLYDLPNKTYSYTLIDANGGGVIPIDTAKIKIGGDKLINRYVKYAVDGDLVLHLTDVSEQMLITDLNHWTTDPNNQLILQETALVNQLIATNDNTLTDAIVFLNNLGFASPDRAKETIDRVITAIPPRFNDYDNQTRVVFHANNSEINKRMAPISSGSACDNNNKRYGAWVSPIYSRGIKKLKVV